jgi:hypothetical protein
MAYSDNPEVASSYSFQIYASPAKLLKNLVAYLGIVSMAIVKHV